MGVDANVVTYAQHSPVKRYSLLLYGLHKTHDNTNDNTHENACDKTSDNTLCDTRCGVRSDTQFLGQ